MRAVGRHYSGNGAEVAPWIGGPGVDVRRIRGRGRRHGGAVLVSLALLMTVPACTIEVPLPPGAATATPSRPSTAPTRAATGAAPGLPPLTRAQISTEDMTFARGGYIAEGESVAFADGMTRTEGWALRARAVDGESVYENGAGCRASLRSTGPQTPLVVDGDDRASTEALFQFLDPSILPGYLTTTTWSWGEDPAEAPAGIEFLTYLQPATDTAPASAVSLRLFHGPGTALAITVSCPSDELLEATVADVRSRVSVVPPRS